MLSKAEKDFFLSELKSLILSLEKDEIVLESGNVKVESEEYCSSFSSGYQKACLTGWKIINIFFKAGLNTVQDLKRNIYPFETDPMGHIWKKDHTGEIDLFALDVDEHDSSIGHNGPICIKCGYSFCHRCHKMPEKRCPEIMPQ